MLALLVGSPQVANGQERPDDTTVRVVYDDRHLYFAFACRSADPARTRTNAGAYLTTQRGLFLKASYLYRF